MEVLSPRSSNVPTRQRAVMKQERPDPKQSQQQKPTNPDRIDDKWQPPTTITEPGSAGESYSIGRKLGKGGFAVCFEGIARSNSRIYALKVVKAKVEQKKMMEKFRTELQIHAKMQHPNIVDFLRAFTSDGHTYVVLELCPNGSLTDMVKLRSCLSLPEVRRFMIQICGGVKYMHKRSVIHRDLKMGNIFLDSQMNVKIGDFGLAAVMADEQDRRTTLCGTPNYIAPEILSKSGTRGHDNKVDTWAVGVICYAMLMGTPPFQSKTQQEIYSKLKTLEYEWKIDSKNYIPQQAKEFVSLCLNLVSAERPEMDDLVEHEFFTSGAIADVLEIDCLKSKPWWLENADLRGDKVVNGYGVSHGRICREAGVGKLPDGKPRPAAGSKANISTLLEIEAENQQGCAPVVPLPEGILYNAFNEAQADWALRQKRPLLPAKPRSRKAAVEVDVLSVSNKNVEALDVRGTGALPETVRLVVPSRPVQSFAAQQRQQALPSRAIPRSTISAQIESQKPAAVVNEAAQGMEGLLKARPLRSATMRVTRSATTQLTNDMPQPTNPISKSISKSTTMLASIRIAEDKTANERYTTSSSSIPRDTKTVTEHSVRSSRPRIDQVGLTAPNLPLFGSTSAESTDRVLQPTTGNDRRLKQTKDEMTQQTHATNHAASLGSSPLLPQVCKSRIISTSEPYIKLKHTSAVDVLSSLQNLYNLITSRTSEDQSDSLRAITSSRRLRARLAYPRVDKWVDYATRHGIAYILTDGTLGMILKSSQDNSRPSSCVVVRDAKAHTIRRAQGQEHQFVPQGRGVQEVEFYEQSNIAADMKRLDVPARVFLLDVEKHGSQVAASNAAQGALEGSQLERMKEVALLDKFGKYMNKQIGDVDCEVDTEPSMQPSEHFIHFYQRLGNVGVWRFADGGLQFNFPDHTKLTIYLDKSSRLEEYLIDLVHLDTKDAKDLARYGLLTSDALERRGMMTLSLSDVLSNKLRRTELDIVKTNELREKVSWIRAVIGCWIKEGGVGRMGEEKLGWSGLQERRDDKKIKLQWVTVGRLGGDGDLAER